MRSTFVLLPETQRTRSSPLRVRRGGSELQLLLLLLLLRAVRDNEIHEPFGEIFS